MKIVFVGDACVPDDVESLGLYCTREENLDSVNPGDFIVYPFDFPISEEDVRKTLAAGAYSCCDNPLDQIRSFLSKSTLLYSSDIPPKQIADLFGNVFPHRAKYPNPKEIPTYVLGSIPSGPQFFKWDGEIWKKDSISKQPYVQTPVPASVKKAKVDSKKPASLKPNQKVIPPKPTPAPTPAPAPPKPAAAPPPKPTPPTPAPAPPKPAAAPPPKPAPASSPPKPAAAPPPKPAPAPRRLRQPDIIPEPQSKPATPVDNRIPEVVTVESDDERAKEYAKMILDYVRPPVKVLDIGGGRGIIAEALYRKYFCEVWIMEGDSAANKPGQSRRQMWGSSQDFAYLHDHRALQQYYERRELPFKIVSPTFKGDLPEFDLIISTGACGMHFPVNECVHVWKNCVKPDTQIVLELNTNRRPSHASSKVKIKHTFKTERIRSLVIASVDYS